MCANRRIVGVSSTYVTQESRMPLEEFIIQNLPFST